MGEPFRRSELVDRLAECRGILTARQEELAWVRALLDRSEKWRQEAEAARDELAQAIAEHRDSVEVSFRTPCDHKLYACHAKLTRREQGAIHGST